MENYQLDELDYKILRLIANDARISFLEVARICNVSGAAVHQRIQKMGLNNIITGSQFSINYEQVGLNTSAYLKLRFDNNSDIEAVIERLKEIPQIVECSSTMALQEVIIKIYAKNNAHLSLIINSTLKDLGVVGVETALCSKLHFSRQITFE